MAIILYTIDNMRNTPFAHMTVPISVQTNRLRILSNMKEDISKDEAEFVLSFAIDAIIQIENHVGDLEAPFGQQRWW